MPDPVGGVWTVILETFSGELQNITRYCPNTEHNLTIPNGLPPGDNYVTLNIPIRTALSSLFDIQVGMELTAGFRQDGWWRQERLFGGRVRSLQYMGKRGGMLLIRLYLDTLNYVFTETVVKSWPDPVALRYEYHNPPAPSDTRITGYEDLAQTAKTWLVGITPYLGLIPRHLNGVDLSGVDLAVYNVDHFDATSRPTNTYVPGYFEGLYLGDAIELVLGMEALLQQALHNKFIRPAYYMKPTVDLEDPSRMNPQFCAVDLNSTTVSNITFSTNPDTSEVGEWWNYTLTADAALTFQRIVVIGSGGDDAGYDPVTGTRKLRKVYYEDDRFATNTYPVTKYQAEPGRALLVKDEGITTLATARALAERLGTELFITRTTVEFDTYKEVQLGWIFRIEHQPTMGALVELGGINYAVMDVTHTVEQSGRTVYHVTGGWPHPTPEDLIQGQLRTVLALKQAGITISTPAATQRGYANFWLPNLPSENLPNQSPFDSNRNFVMSVMNRSTVNTNKPAVNGSKTMPDGRPIGTNAANYYEAPIPEPTTRRPTINPTAVDKTEMPAPHTINYDPDTGTITNWWDDKTGDHPIGHSYNFTFDGEQLLVMPKVRTILSTVKVSAHMDGAGNFVDPPGTGVTLSLKWRNPATGLTETVTPAVDRDHPFILYPTDQMAIVAAGVPDGGRISVLVSEEDPNPWLFMPKVTAP